MGSNGSGKGVTKINRRAALRRLARYGFVAGLGATALAKQAWRAKPMSDDPHRPLYHFLPPRNWMNDPNGLIQFGGRYHLFYQHNPNAPVWGDIHWGHATSADLVRWEHQPVALAPTPGGPDAEGCWSGCAVDDGGVPTVLYTGVAGGRQTQCLATSHDGLRTWQKYAGNPVLEAVPAGMKPSDFRDPFVWRQGGEWLMVVGAAQERGFGVALLYRSDDLRQWAYLGPLLEGSRQEHGWMWECPNFFALGDRHVLLISNGLTRQVFYFVGRFDGRKFTAEKDGLLSADDSYAPLTFQDALGRRLLFAWVDEPRAEAERVRAGWAGLASLPRELRLGARGTLSLKPAAEVGRLRGRALTVGKPTADGVLPGVRGDALELEVEFRASGGLAVRGSPDRAEETVIAVNRSLGVLTIDRTRSALKGDVARGVHSVPLGDVTDRLTLRVFVDRSVVEVFVVGGPSITSRIYPSRPDSLGVRLLTDSGAHPAGVRAWELMPTS